MKKLLLATAALALIAPAAQAEIKLDLGGYFKGYAGYADQDTVNLRTFDIRRKSEIFFEGETTLDNGLTVGYHGELFQENSATGENNLEASYLYMSGNWGRVNLGRENGAAYLLQVSAPAGDANFDGADIDFSFYNPTSTNYRQDYAAEGAGPIGGTAADGGQYSDKITYLTPKFNGFQAGVSYSPEFDAQLIGHEAAGMDPDNTNGNLEHLMEGAVRYDGEFSGVGIHVGGGYAMASDEGVAPETDFDQWNAGLKLTFEGFSLGGAYINEEVEPGAGALGGAAGTEIDTYVIGAGYDYGAYSFGATFFNSEEDISGDELDRYTFGAGYTFGPGMKFNGSVALYDENDTAGNNDATVVAIGTDIQF